MSKAFRLAVVGTDTDDEVVVESGGKLLPLSAVVGADAVKALNAPLHDLTPLVEAWDAWDKRLAEAVSELDPKFRETGLDIEGRGFRPPISAPGKIICVGANYHDHIAEMPIPMKPSYPYTFIKPANNTLRGSGDSVSKPKIASMMDWEAELAVIIGKECRDLSADDALSAIAGYANFNDLSARDWLEERPPIGVDWVLHKGFDGFAPFGPFLTPARFVDDPQKLSIRLSVNGVVKQDSSTSQMVFGVAEIIKHVSAVMTLYPGDVIATGTPAGVGNGRNPPEYLTAGDEVRMEIEGLGELVTRII